MRKLLKTAACTIGAVMLGTGSAAIADSGEYVRWAEGVVFYYGVSNGDSDSYDFQGGPVYEVCQDAPGVNYASWHYSKLYRNRTLQADDLKVQAASQYYDPRKCSKNWDTSADSEYHVRVDWVYANAPDRNNGYGRGETP